MDREKVTDLILNGDQRLYHKIAIHVAKKKGVQVVVTDFGYLRPDWITFESQGSSGNSQIPKNKSEIRRLAESCEQVDLKERYWDNKVKFAFVEARSGLLTWLFGFLYPGYRPFYSYHPISLGLAFCMTYLKKRVSHSTTCSTIRRLINERFDNPFYFFPMQLETDFQIRAYSRYPNQSMPIEEVLISFAENAPENARLVFKMHPLDPDLVNWKKTLRSLVREVGISNRVFFLRDGPIADLLTNASGVVTINSSVGLKALQHGKKLKIMGQAVYDVPGLVFPKNLDEFWISDFVPDASLFTDFIQVLASMFQIRGVYFGKEGLRHAINEAAMRLHLECVNKLMPASQSESVL
jgi:capsular polysaccharide export protein